MTNSRSKRDQSYGRRAAALIVGALLVALLASVGLPWAASTLGVMAGGRAVPPTGTLPYQHAWFTAAAETMDAAALTPLPPSVFSTLTPDQTPPPTPDYRQIPHRWTDSGVIIQGPPDVFANCYKMLDEIDGVPAPWVENVWYRTKGPDDPTLAAYAGSYVDQGDEWPDLPRSAVFVVDLRVDRCGLDPRFPPFTDGPLEIIAAAGQELTLRSRYNGKLVVFDVASPSFKDRPSTPTPGPSATPRPTLPVPDVLDSYTVFALDSAVIGVESEIQYGAIGVGLHRAPNQGFIQVGPVAYVGPYALLAADEVSLGARAIVGGDIVSNALSIHQSADFLGLWGAPLDSVLELPPFPEIALDPGAPQVTVPIDGYRTLGAGEYGEVVVLPRATLRLEEGTYEAKSLRVEQGGVVQCLGRCDLLIAEHMRVGPDAVVEVDYSESESPLLRLFVGGTTGLAAEQGSFVEVWAYVPSGPIDLGPNGEYWGTFIGKRFSLGRSSTVSLRPWAHWETP